ncbi:hypothetical protein [Paenarthrobacter nitroguajacolicus]
MPDQKPRSSRHFVVSGLLIHFVGAIITSFSLPASFARYSGSSAIPVVLFGITVLLLGFILFLVGIGRAAGGIDYLVRVSAVSVEKQVPKISQISDQDGPVRLLAPSAD